MLQFKSEDDISKILRFMKNIVSPCREFLEKADDMLLNYFIDL